MKELMQDEKGKVVRERVSEMSRRAKAALEVGGSSRVDFYNLTKSWNL